MSIEAKLTLVCLVVLIAPSVAALARASPVPDLAAPAVMPPIAATLGTPPPPAPPPIAASDRIHPALRDLSGPVQVTVLTTDVSALAAALEGVDYQGLLGHDAVPGLAAPTLTLPSSVIDHIAALPSTLSIGPAQYPEKHLVADPETQGTRPVGLTNYNSSLNLGAGGAWANGFFGNGTRVAVMDDGLDFSHPDLLGTAARVEDRFSPYYPLPTAFDPFSMSTYLSTGQTTNTWYANTSSTDRNVTHTIRVDGKNDFWTDGTELLGTDLRGDIAYPTPEGNQPDLDLFALYVTQDRDFWYVGFNSLANQTNMSFGVYVNTTASAPFTAGGTSDPAGNFVDTIPGQRPEFALYFRHYGLQSDPALFDKNETIPASEVYRWTGSSWAGPTVIDDTSIGGAFSYSGWSFANDLGFLEFSLPKAYLGSPPSLSFQVFTLGFNATHAQDTVYSDPAVNYATFDPTAVTTTLSAAVAVGDGFWRHSYTRPDDTIGGVLNTQKTWSTLYQVTGTSQSGAYYFGDLPDENFPLTRLLVVDEAVAGTYDTVYMDLDHNKDFTNDKPLRRFGEYTPAGLRYDPGTCPGPCTTYDEYAWGDYYDPARGVTAVDWASDDSWIATGSNDHTVLLFDPATGTRLRELTPHFGRVTDVAFSPDVSKLAVAIDDASGKGDFVAVVYDTATWTISRVLRGHAARLNGLAWSSDNVHLATVSSDDTGRIWDVTTGTFVPLSGHTGPVNAVSWAASGLLVTGSDDATTKVWNSAGALQTTLTSSPIPVTAVAITGNGTWIATGARDGNVVIWDRPGSAFWPYGSGIHVDHTILRMRWNALGELASSSEAEGTGETSVAIWAGATYDSFNPTRELAAHTDADRGYAVPGIAWNNAGTKLATGGLDKLGKTWAGAILTREYVLGGHLDGSLDPLTYRNGDGIADVSGGMMYFLADGVTPLPYSARYASRLGIGNRVPPAGQLLALYGAFDGGSSHGTLMASSIAGQSVSRFFDPSTMDEPSFPQVAGIAPGARLVGIGNIYVTTIFDAWFFSVEGYDGLPNSGDEVQVVANSFGFSSTYQDGWDLQSRFLDYVSYYQGGDAVAFTVSSGNDGNGYGTVTSPASAPNVLTVGASTDFFYRKHAALEGGPSPSFGDVVPFSSRGPSAQGRPDPDILATGRMSVGATPLNFRAPYNGAAASELWSGTSLASPMAAGSLAMVYQAYASANGGNFPNASQAKSFLLSGADDVNNDVFAQGAGLVNVDRATKLAARLDGVHVSPNVWVPGDYQGTRYAAFPAFLSPGETDSQTFQLQNQNLGVADTPSISSGVYHLKNEYRYGFTTRVDASNAPLPDWSSFYVNTPLANGPGMVGPGIYRTVGLSQVRMATIDPLDWLQTDLLRVVFYANTTTLDPNLDGAFDYRYMIDIFDWTWDGFSTPVPDTTGFQDLNRVTINHPDANHWEARIHNPAARTHTGLVAGFRPFGAGAAGLYISAVVQLYRREAWNWVTVNPASPALPPGSSNTFTATVSVPPGTPVGTYEGGIYLESNPTPATWSFTATNGGEQYFALPKPRVATAAPFTVAVNTVPLLASDYTLYSASGGLALTNPLALSDVLDVAYSYLSVTTIPVAVTVPAPAVQFSFGGSAPGQDELYGDHVDMGFGNGGQGGDWHFLFVDVPLGGLFDGSSGVRFLVDAQWDRSRTDLNIFAFGQGGSVPSSIGVNFPVDRYGPVLLMTNNGGSEETATFFTTTGGAREIVAPKLAAGLNVLALRQVRLNGTLDRERFSGSVGLMSATPDAVAIVTNQLAGSTGLQVWSSIPWQGVGAVSAGPSAPESYVNVPIKQDNIEGDFIDLLAHGSYTRTLRLLPSALIFDVHITSDAATTARPCPDLDLGVFLDGKGVGRAPNGIAEVEEFVAYGADSDADEQVRLIKPSVEDDPDTVENELVTGAPYLVKVLGFTVPYSPTGTFNIDITLVQGAGFSVGGTTSDLQVPYNVTTVNLAWNLPGSTADGRMLGALYVGPENAPLTLLIPVDLILDRVAPTVASVSLAARLGFRTDVSTNATVNDPRPSLIATIRDSQGRLDPTRFTARLDGGDVSPWVTTLYPVTALGRVEATLTFVPPAPLSEGGHAYELVAFDTAGNPASQVFTFSVDTAAPSLALDASGTIHTRDANVTVSGTTDPGAAVTVGGTDAPVSSIGAFSRTWALSDGVNRVDVTAVDWFETIATGDRVAGNSLTQTVTVVVDRQRPTITLLSGTLIGPVSANQVDVLASVRDLIAPGVDNAPGDLTVTVNGAPAFLRADGRLEATVTLAAEGPNAILFTATDPAGNVATATLTALRDTTDPVLTVDELDTSVSSGSLNLTGSTVGADRITVNGRLLTPLADGTFFVDLQLSPGRNDLIIVAEDEAGNRVTELRSVQWVGPRATGISGAIAAIAVAIAAVAGILAALLFFRPTPGGPPEEEAVPTVDDRMERLEKALKSGKIDQATYERNAAKLRAEKERAQISASLPSDIPPPEAVPAAVPAPRVAELPPSEEAAPVPATKAEPPSKPATPSFEDRVNRLEEAYRSGRIPKAAYEANLAKLRGEVAPSKVEPAAAPTGAAAPEERPPEAPSGPRAEEELPTQEEVPQERAEPVPAPAPILEKPAAPTAEDRIAKLESAYKEGRISRDAYEASLKKLGVAPKPPAAPSVDERAAKLEEAYKAGRITRESYEANLAKMGRAVPEDERVTKLRKAFEEGRISKEAYEANLKKIRGST